MEIKISNNTISIINATKTELREVSQFLFDDVPYNAVKEIAVDTPVTEVDEIKETTETDKYVNPAQLAKEMGVCHQLIDYYIKRKVNPLPIAKRNGEIRLIDRNVAKEYFEKYPISNSKNKTAVAINEDVKGLLTLSELSKAVGKAGSTLAFHVKNGMPIAKEINNKRYFNLEDCKAYLALHNSSNCVKNLKHQKEVPLVVNPYPIWQKEIMAKIKSAGKDTGKTCSEVFRKMKSIYGIDLNEEKKQFYKDKGTFPKSTIETAYYVQYEQNHKDNEHFENIFENLLETVI